MVLKALTDYGQALVRRGVIPPLGWSLVNVNYALVIDDDGNLLNVRSLAYEEQATVKGKTKMVTKYPSMCVPYRSKHQSGLTPFFVCDNAAYLLGLRDDKDAPDKVAAKHRSAKELHQEILADIHTVKAEAIKKFFAAWDADTGKDLPFIQESIKDILSVSNIVFQFISDESYAQDAPEIADAWNAYYAKMMQEGEETVFGTCLITGERNVPIARVHPATTGVPGIRGTGVSLVSFGTNYDVCAYNYFDKQQGYIAPISSAAAEQYGNALKYLLTNPRHTRTMGNTRLAFWANPDDSDTLSTAFIMANFGRYDTLYNMEADNALYDAVTAILSGSPKTDAAVELLSQKTTEFYILGLRDHMARFAVVLFQKSTFGDILDNVRNHLACAEIVSAFGGEETYRPNIYQLIDGMKNPADSLPIPQNIEEMLFQAVISGTPYPPAMIDSILQRISSDGNVSQARAAALKMFLLRNGKTEKEKEAATVAINRDCTDPAYLLGQLFWYYESLQKTALGKVNTTVKDKYFSSAMVTPDRVFPILAAKSTHHIRNMRNKRDKAGLAYYYDKTISGLIDQISLPFPHRLSKEASCAFVLGYYHAKQDFFVKKTPASVDDAETTENAADVQATG